MNGRIEMGDAGGAAVDKIGILSQRRFKRGKIAANDGFDRGFEFEYPGIGAGDGVGIFRESLPIQEVVPACDGELRIGKRQRGALDFRVRRIRGEPGDFRVQEFEVVLFEEVERIRIGGFIRAQQCRGLGLVLVQRGIEWEPGKVHASSPRI